MKLYHSIENLEPASAVVMHDSPFYVVIEDKCVLPLYYEGQRAFGFLRFGGAGIRYDTRTDSDVWQSYDEAEAELAQRQASRRQERIPNSPKPTRKRTRKAVGG